MGTQISDNNHNMFCPGINNLPNGNLLVAGGGSAPKTTIYNVQTNRWETSDDMNVARGYQGNVTLPDGRAFTIGGQWSGGPSAKDAEIWTEGQGWRNLPGIPESVLFNQNDLQGRPVRPADHAWLWVGPNGKVFHAGPSEDMHWFDLNGNGSSTFAGKRANDTYSITGTTIMYDIGKILKVGGALNYQQGFPAKDNSFVIDINNENNVTVSPTANNLQLSRSYHNSVVLPNGEVVVTGGLSTSSIFTDAGARFEAEIWNPQTNRWRTVAGMQIPRTYHSVSILMTDGRVFVGGGGLFFGGGNQNHLDAEIYSPPYLYDGSGNLAQRPTLNAPATAGVSQQFTVNGSDDITEFSFIRMSSATHSTNNEQRRVPVSFTKNGNQYILNVPNANIITPGYYMLFALNANGVPSIAETVLVGNNGTVTPPPPPPAVSGTNLAPEAESITVSSVFSDAYPGQGAVDGVTGQIDGNEWASLGEENPSIRLTWNRTLTTAQIVLFDRANTVDQINGAILRFSDGSTINVDALDNNGAARLIEFPEKTVTWVELDITNGAGANVGLSEFEVYGEYTDDGG
ncbi:galactose oxidase-like domain-containing protein, partial [Maribacter sp. 2307ULW6-5]|uniref:DUF7402 domain-containing protein n=1 Tax=Maribacter sp. 2307ULW6-5 TaxID=3386275 RepID=UPI0039BD7991